LFACGDGGGSSTSAPATAPAEAAEAAPSAQQISAEARSCLDLVKAGRYSDAIAPCERALKDTADADVQSAYNEAKAAVEKEAKAAAAKTLSDSMAGKPVDQAAAGAASDAAGNLGGGAPSTD